MRVWLDGVTLDVPEGTLLSTLLDDRGEPAEHALVEVNGEYVPLRALAERTLREGDRVEVILPACGG